jgi:hypothetical protein
MKNYTVISGDLVAYTSLNALEKEQLEQQLEQLFIILKEHFNTYGRRVKGDYLECVVPNPAQALQVALILKTAITAFEIDRDSDDERLKAFQTYGIRLALGYGTLDRYDPEKGIIDGEAIYKSGRAISKESTHNKDRIVIKNTMFVSTNDSLLKNTLETLLALLDHILSKVTTRQSEILYHKLLGKSEKEIAAHLGISQPSVNQHSTASGWNAIDKTVHYYSTLFSNLS